MHIVSKILVISIFFVQSVLAKETLFDNPILLKEEKGCKLSEFCEKYIQDIDIEKFIKQEIEADYVVVSLDECLDVALKNNFDIDIKDHTYLSSKYEYQNSLSKFLPILNTTSYIADYRGQILVGGVLRDTFHETALSVNITAEHHLTEGGKQIFESKAAKYFSKAQKHEFTFTKSQVVFLTVKYYYQMLLAKINIEIYLRNLIERNAQYKLALNLEKSGFGTNFDVVRSKNESAQAKISLYKALSDFRLSQTRLANLMGIKVETALMPFEDDINPLNLLDEKLVSVDELYKQALSNREDLKSFSDLIAYEKQIKNVYMTDFFPKPLVNFQQQFQGTLNHSVSPNYIIAGYLSWMPGENCIMGTLTKIKAQKEIIKIKVLEYQNKLREIEQQIVDAYVSTGFNKKEMEVAKKRVEYSNQSVKLAMLRFNHGKGILLDVIQAQSQMTQARVEYVSAIIKYNISQSELLFASGRIDKETIVKNYHP